LTIGASHPHSELYNVHHLASTAFHFLINDIHYLSNMVILLLRQTSNAEWSMTQSVDDLKEHHFSGGDGSQIYSVIPDGKFAERSESELRRVPNA
jgi:hypothetical protein